VRGTEGTLLSPPPIHHSQGDHGRHDNQTIIALQYAIFRSVCLVFLSQLAGCKTETDDCRSFFDVPSFQSTVLEVSRVFCGSLVTSLLHSAFQIFNKSTMDTNEDRVRTYLMLNRAENGLLTSVFVFRSLIALISTVQIPRM